MRERKRYCIFSAQYLPHMGGVERYTYNLAKNLVERGNDVTVVTSNISKLLNYEKADGIHIYRIPCLSLLDGRYPVLKINKKFIKIHRMLNHKQYDIVIVNTRFYLHSLYGMLFAKRRGLPCITIEHGTSHLSVHNSILDRIGAVYEHFLTKIECLLCKDFYGVSGACNEWLMHFHIKAKGVLYNSIDIEAFQQVEEIRKYRKQYNISEDMIAVTFTGRLLKEKGLPQLMSVIERLHKERNDICLFIAGDGDLEKEVENYKSDYIIPLGRIPFIDIVTLLRESDIFCLPSFSEGFSTSILEAAACQCYILTTERGGSKELIINRNYGSIIPDNKEETLYLELKSILDDLDRRKKAVELTYQRLESHFTWDKMVDKVETICDKVCG